MKRKAKSLPTAAWDYRRRLFGGRPSEGHYAAMAEIEQAFIAGARWGKRRGVPTDATVDGERT